MSIERNPPGPKDTASSPETPLYPGISAERLDTAAITDPLQEFRHNAEGIFALSRTQNTNPRILHFLVMNSSDRSTAFEAWRILKAMNDMLPTPTMIHLVLNVQYPSIALEAWRLATGCLDLTREQMQSVALHANDAYVREEANSMIGR